MLEKELVKKTFAKNPQNYLTSSTHAKGIEPHIIENWLQPSKTMDTLDIATGGGHVARQLSPYVRTVYATDLTKEMLANTKHHLQAFTNLVYILADAEQLPFLNDSFDLVTCRIAAHHFPQPEQFIREVKRVMKPDGKFLFIDNVVPNIKAYEAFMNQVEKMRDESHVKYLSIIEWKRLLQQYGLVIRQQQVNKKILTVSDWLDRTLDTEAEKKRVADFLLQANEKLTAYYQMEKNAEKPQQFSIDEWMALVEHE
ncbi:SAM-dependent methyltransferase [Virgibacillus pantothenticus]|uniref:class I SAM-dependent methyltransferase n=1 Tax=Virgibacillus pantothenticus TaxID=1473 RepID=UPI001B045340|nr:class I SAM-dependent methyltransferase [Virgibacillus pantothenticus]GIP62152.1 SAM-dependent methyltransferase [Virgibacillus pantothenticus]